MTYNVNPDAPEEGSDFRACRFTHALPYGKTDCDQPATSEVLVGDLRWVPVCQDVADDLGVQGERLRSLQPRDIAIRLPQARGPQ